MWLGNIIIIIIIIERTWLRWHNVYTVTMPSYNVYTMLHSLCNCFYGTSFLYNYEGCSINNWWGAAYIYGSATPPILMGRAQHPQNILGPPTYSQTVLPRVTNLVL